MSGVKDKIVSFFKTNTNESYSKPRHAKYVYRRQEKSKKQLEDKIKQSKTK